MYVIDSCVFFTSDNKYELTSETMRTVGPPARHLSRGWNGSCPNRKEKTKPPTRHPPLKLFNHHPHMAGSVSYESFLLILTSSAPDERFPSASKRWMKRKPCCVRSKRMQAQAAKSSLPNSSSLTLNLLQY
jgi:hypothetical protein